MNKRIFWWVGVVFVVCSLSVPVLQLKAADFRSSDQTGSITVDSGVETKNLFIAGNELVIQAKEIKKDLFAFGMNIDLNTYVEQGSFLAGKTVNISGFYGGNLFVVGSEITINAEVMGDVFLFCNKWSLKPEAKIHGDVHVGSGTGYHDGFITGSLLGSGNEFYLNGTVEQTTKLRVAKSLTIGEKANLNLLDYEAPQKATVLEGAVIQKTDYQTPDANVPITQKSFHFPLVSYVASLIFALLFVFWLRKPMRHILNTIQQQFFVSLGIGFAVLIGIPIVALLIFLSVIGYKIALALLFCYALGILCMSPVAGIWLGEWILRLFKRPVASPSWLGAVIGITVMPFIAWIPLFGWFLLFFLNIFSFGGLVITIFSHLKGMNET
ncbi:hypothetical protein LLG10_01610 [bacterium]|nr:hypothetical protein [bacterium]